MSSDGDDGADVRRIRPLWRPFVLRPTFIGSIPFGLVLAACFFFREPLRAFVGGYLSVIPVICVVIPVLIFIERVIRYDKTSYEIRPDRFIVETGSLFSSRTVELDVTNITLVEWNSPFLLRTFYGAGHITAQEAGSGAQPAHMTYVEDPEGLYEKIAEVMERRGFTLDRQRLVQEETPGHVGAAVDFTAVQTSVFGVLLVILAQPEFSALLVGEGPTLVRLVSGDYSVYSHLFAPDAFFRIWLGTLLIGGILLALLVVWWVTLYVDLLHRKYTLYNDVIDYEDGFLNETRKFIPLENLADTKVDRPLHKRMLGLSDVTLSSEGAENAIAFKSTPDGPAFAEAITELVRKSDDLDDSSRLAEERGGEEATEDDDSAARVADAGDVPPEATLEETFQPGGLRAALRGVSFVPFVLLIVAPLLFPLLADASDSASFAIGGAAGIACLGIGAAVLISAGGAVWWLVLAGAMEFEFDERGARYSYELLSSEEKRFGPERITSVSVYRNPFDWIAGTMSLRFRSIGSEEDIDFWGIDTDSDLLDVVRRRLRMPESSAPQVSGALTPEYRLSDGLKAGAPTYAFWGLLMVLGAGGLAFVGMPTDGVVPAILMGFALAWPLFEQTWRWAYHARMEGALFDEHLENTGGIFTHFRHLAPLEHVKAVDRRRNPGSEYGRLTFKTAGFPIRIDHLPDVAGLHDRVDSNLGLDDAASGAGGPGSEVLARLQPSPPTEAVRQLWTLLFGIGLVTIPYAYVYYSRVDYTIESGRFIADSGLYFDHRTTILFGRVDHIETSREFANQFFDTRDVEVYTVGSRSRDMVLSSIPRGTDALGVIRERLDFE